MNDTSLLLMLILGHIVGDFYLQPKHWVECRYRHHFTSISIYKHTGVHGLLSLAILLIFSQQSWMLCIALALFILLSHWLIDAAKSYLPANVTWFLVDQALHLICLAGVWFWLQNTSLATLIQTIQTALSAKVFIITLAYVVCSRPISIFITIVLKKWTPDIEKSKQQNTGSESSLISAGETIGYLERWLVLSFLLLNQFSGIGFLLAAKSVFRFNDLSKSKDMKLTEYVILGTLTSITSALAIGFITQQLIT